MGCPAHLLREQRGPFDSSTPDLSLRGRLAGTNGHILNRILRHRHFLLRSENGVIRDLVAVLRAAKEAVTDELGRVGVRTGATAMNELRRERLRALEVRLDEILGIAQADAEATFRRRALSLAEREAEIQAGILRGAIPDVVDLDLVGPDLDRLAAIIEEPLGGRRWTERMRRNFGETAVAMRRNLATSAALGEGMDQAGRRLRRTVDTISVNRSVLIARSEIQRVAYETASQVYRANQDVIKGEMWVATLDDKSCFICAPLDGQVFAVGQGPRPVSDTHAACRCFRSPVTRSFEELGIDASAFSPSTRASMDGQVPDSVTYRDWFRQQDADFQRRVLGPRRFELFRSGAVDIDGFTRDARVLPLDELPALSLG